MLYDRLKWSNPNLGWTIQAQLELSYLIPCSRHAGPVLYVVPNVHKVYRVGEVEEEKKEEKPKAKSKTQPGGIYYSR